MNRSPRRAGLSLVELLVVLFLLTLVAGIAVTATEGLVDQGRLDATTRVLDQVEGAIGGDRNWRHADARPWIAGFVADLGRLPKVRGAVPKDALMELWRESDSPVTTYQLPLPGALAPAAMAVDPDVMPAPAAWKGPYLRPGSGEIPVADGWGRALALLKGDGTPAASGDEIAGLQSLGADAAPGGSGQAEDIHRDLSGLYLRQVRLVVQPKSGDSNPSFARLYYWVEGARFIHKPDPVLSAGTVFVFTRVPVGIRIARAYQAATEPTDDTAAYPPCPRSQVLPLTIIPGPLPDFHLEIQ